VPAGESLAGSYLSLADEGFGLNMVVCADRMSFKSGTQGGSPIPGFYCSSLQAMGLCPIPLGGGRAKIK
jgi:hypothetical protein